MGIIEEWEKIKKRKNIYTHAPGSVENIFKYNEKCQLNEDGTRPVIIKIEPEEKKKKKSIN